VKRNKIILLFLMSLMIFLIKKSNTEEFRFIYPSEEDKCPVCGMLVHKYPQWSTEIIFKDGTYVVFDGPKDMFNYYFKIFKYNKSRSKDDIAEIYVTEYYTTKKIKVKDAYFVVGSAVYGPMGEELVPVKGKKEAETFLIEHKGKKILTFKQISPEDIP